MLVTKIAEAVKDSGTRTAFAAQIGENRSSVSDVLSGRRDPTPRMLKFLGLENGYITKSERAA